MSVLFADLVGFTGRAERLDPEDVRALLAPYHAPSARRARALRRHGREVHRRCGDGAVRRAGRPRGRPGAGRAGGARDPRLGRRRGRASCRCGSRVNTGEALVAPRRAAERGRGHGRRRRRQHRRAAAGGGAGERHPRRREQTYRATAHAIDYREPSSRCGAKGKSEPVPAWEAVAGAVALRRRRRARRRRPARRPRARARARSSRRARARARGACRRSSSRSSACPGSARAGSSHELSATVDGRDRSWSRGARAARCRTATA